ncbi:MAG TPA: ATP-binding cassette domain-containing protein [Solirubrobacteraceae bacterium]|nr:ATP-binding cassette domain-containing protein [Solirubrobacteraceae bacterium]
MSLLELEGVDKRHREGDLESLALRNLDLSLDAGELTVVWGMRGSGRSTLLRVAAGIEAPDAGVVRFDGRDLAKSREELLGAGIGFCQKSLPPNGSQSVLDLVMVSLLACGISAANARSRARLALERVGAVELASLSVPSLDVAEAIRVALARVLALEPRLLVIDDPIGGVDLLARDGILALLRRIADDGVAVLASTGESAALSGADRTLALSEGELRGPPPAELAPVLPLRRASARLAGA